MKLEEAPRYKLKTKNLNLFYGAFHALKKVTISLQEKKITALIGPSGCGKSTLLRTFNRMNDTVLGVKISGSVQLDNTEIYSRTTDVASLRKRVGMVFQRPNPFPLSVIENVTFGPQIHGEHTNALEIAEKSLRAVHLWDELKDNLKKPALSLSGEQQQRLCLARVLAVKPEMILLDEPTSALDPISSSRLEELFRELSQEYTIAIVTHNMQQAARISDRAGYMLLGELVEIGPTKQIFTSPTDPRTEEYITGRYG